MLDSDAPTTFYWDMGFFFVCRSGFSRDPRFSLFSEQDALLLVLCAFLLLCLVN